MIQTMSWHSISIFVFSSIIRAETETKLKLEKVAEIKKINAQMMAIKRCILIAYAV